jgi:hypothetical protein
MAKNVLGGTGTTGTGLDDIVEIILTDPGFVPKVGWGLMTQGEIIEGAEAADAMNHIIVDSIRATGLANNGEFNMADIRTLNGHIHDNYYDQWVVLHGDDEANEETGFHLVQADGGTTKLFGYAAVDVVADQIYHLAFDIDEAGFTILNEDGTPNTGISNLAKWLNQLLEDDLSAGNLANSNVDAYVEGSTGTGLDQLVNIITNSAGLQINLSTDEIAAGAKAADGLNNLIVDSIKATGVAGDGNISANDVRDLNTHIRANHATEWTDLYGYDAGGVETGYHLVQGDGAQESLFGYSAVETLGPRLYNIGRELNGNNFQPEPGDPASSVFMVSDLLNQVLDEDYADGTFSDLV